MEYLRSYQTTQANPTPYKGKKALVGVKYVSYFNVHFYFQYLLLNKVHFSLDELKHPQHAIMPEDPQYFAACHFYLPEIFDDATSFRAILQAEGHKHYFINNVLAFVESLKDIYFLWKMQVLRNEDFVGEQMPTGETELNLKQNLVLMNLKSFLFLRDTYYGISAEQNEYRNDNDSAHEIDESESDTDSSDEDANDNAVPEHSIPTLNLPTKIHL